MPCGERAEYDPVPGDGSQALAACLAPAALRTVLVWERPTASAARAKPRTIRAGRPWLTCYCPGCGVVGEIDLRRIDRHPGASIESLIPHLSCQRCSPHPPFARLIGLAARPGVLVQSRSAR
jgi:hypothetical protein